MLKAKYTLLAVALVIVGEVGVAVVVFALTEYSPTVAVVTPVTSWTQPCEIAAPEPPVQVIVVTPEGIENFTHADTPKVPVESERKRAVVHPVVPSMLSLTAWFAVTPLKSTTSTKHACPAVGATVTAVEVALDEFFHALLTLIPAPPEVCGRNGESA